MTEIECDFSCAILPTCLIAESYSNCVYSTKSQNSNTRLNTDNYVLTQGKFPIYIDSFLVEFPLVSLFTACSFSLDGATLGGATLVVSFLS